MLTLPPSAPVVPDAPTVSPSIADRLEGAAALIEERGLAKHTQRDRTGAMCLWGAFCVASFGNTMTVTTTDDLGVEFTTFVAAALRERGVEPIALAPDWMTWHREAHGLAGWNNAPERTAAEVCAVLRRAASLSRAQVSA